MSPGLSCREKGSGDATDLPRTVYGPRKGRHCVITLNSAADHDPSENNAPLRYAFTVLLSHHPVPSPSPLPARFIFHGHNNGKWYTSRTAGARTRNSPSGPNRSGTTVTEAYSEPHNHDHASRPEHARTFQGFEAVGLTGLYLPLRGKRATLTLTPLRTTRDSALYEGPQNVVAGTISLGQQRENSRFLVVTGSSINHHHRPYLHERERHLTAKTNRDAAMMKSNAL